MQKKAQSNAVRRAVKKFKDVQVAAGQQIAANEHAVAECLPQEVRVTRTVGTRILDMTVVESLAQIGMTYEQIVSKLRLDRAELAKYPELISEIQTVCEGGLADMIETAKRDMMAHSKKNVIGSIAVLRAAGCPEYQEKKKETTNTGNANEALANFMNELVARKRIEREQIMNAMEEERMRKEGRAAGMQPPVLGSVDPQTGAPTFARPPDAGTVGNGENPALTELQRAQQAYVDSLVAQQKSKGESEAGTSDGFCVELV